MNGPPSAPRAFERFPALPRYRLPRSSQRSLASTASSPSTRSPGTTALRRFRSGPGTANDRLSRTGNRQLNAALHRIALTRARYHPDAILFTERRVSGGDSGKEAVRALKRRLSDVVYRAMTADLEAIASTPPTDSLAAA
jgi:hypothetical protein